MTESYKEVNARYYEQELARWGNDVHALWGNTESQQERFQVLSELGDFSGKSVLDVGCGFGDFYDFLRGKGIHFHYLGIDLSEKMIVIAKQKFPEASFEVRDILSKPLPDASFDFVVASGIFPLKIPRWMETTGHILSAMYKTCRIGTGVNFLSTFTIGKKFPGRYYANPAIVVDFACKNLSPRIVLRHDYRPNDFTLHIYKPFKQKGNSK